MAMESTVKFASIFVILAICIATAAGCQQKAVATAQAVATVAAPAVAQTSNGQPSVVPPQLQQPNDKDEMSVHPTKVDPNGPLPPGHPPLDAPMAVEIGQIAVADHTIVDLRQNRTTLAGQMTAIRGRVTKINRGILDRNWLHLQDKVGEKDLVVTTTSDAKPGDLVLAKGKVSVDRDVGAGYQFDVLLEDASVVVESSATSAPTAATPVH